MSESSYSRRLLLRVSERGLRMFRNNVGMLKDRFGNWIKYGVCNPGGSDYIGWKSVVITPEMVGCKVAIFAAMEVKAVDGKAPTDDQSDFLRAVRDAGGIALLARESEDSLEEQGPSSTGVVI